MDNRKLSLDVERLTELTTDELTVAVGAAAEVTNTGYLCVTQWPTCDVNRCPTLFC